MADYSDQLKSEYIYGEIIPTSITIKGVADEDVELNLITNAKQTYNEKGEITAHPSVGKYTVQGEFAYRQLYTKSNKHGIKHCQERCKRKNTN